jgi:hypothetical protein
MMNTASISPLSAAMLLEQLQNAETVMSRLDHAFPVDEIKMKPMAMSSDCCGSNNYPRPRE